MIEITNFSGERIEFTTWKFPTGETGFKLTNPDDISNAIVTMTYENNEDIFLTLFAVNALRELDANVCVYVPYLPYSRQDRVCHKGESFSLNVLLDMIESSGVQFVTDDIHNPQSLSLCENLSNCPQSKLSSHLPKFDMIIAPDKGAAFKIMENQQVREGTPVITLNKQRIGQDVVYMNHEFDTIKGDVCVVDDLCDGGGTFISLAKMLKETQPNIKSLSLYVTHGFFTKGIDVIKQHYNNVYVYNLYNKAYNDSVINLKEQNNDFS